MNAVMTKKQMNNSPYSNNAQSRRHSFLKNEFPEYIFNSQKLAVGDS
jgi:hypothetical protein